MRPFLYIALVAMVGGNPPPAQWMSGRWGIGLRIGVDFKGYFPVSAGSDVLYFWSSWVGSTLLNEPKVAMHEPI